jgi:hypothetical protein
MAFTNVRLLPCLVKDGAGRQLTALTEALAPAAAPAHAAISAGASPAFGVADASGTKAEHEQGSLRRVLGELSEGFGRATREAGEAADGLNDSRLAVQLGMLLGVVYLAFLSVWFWATRVRWNQRA